MLNVSNVSNTPSKTNEPNMPDENCQRKRTREEEKKKSEIIFSVRHQNNIRISRLLIVTMALHRRLDIISATLTMRTNSKRNFELLSPHSATSLYE